MSDVKVHMDKVTETYLEKFIKFLKTDSIRGVSTGGAVRTFTTEELKHEFVKWLEAGEPENGLGPFSR